MRAFLLLLAFVATGCAGKDGTWPSLARRPIEGSRPSAAAVGTPVATAAVVTAPAAVPPPATGAGAAIGDVPAQLATIDRDAENLGTRIGEQRAATAEAAKSAKGTKADSEEWAKAQLELTRLERLGNQLGDLRGKLDGIAGKLAAAAGGGADVAAPLKATGAVIGRVDALQAEYDASYSAASMAATAAP
ncbi:hypothetical protein [Polymorphobacter megasporae]|uniref:hypothetical protein n=1 Tax=Glacieibacterium megasporae TaxID=2835787 RepID=UPI001C1E6248|nr:hypothetical protein [Polymorphobacter megasporae]UAJ10452.1 hypothetical protein KTC28_01425 [Polymorphobacter megasporae]